MVPSPRRSIARQIVSGPSSISLAPRLAATPSRTRAAASWSRKARPKASRGEFPAAATKNAYSDCECTNRKNGRLPNVTTLQCQSTVDTASGTGASPDGVSRSLTCAFFVHLKFIESRSARYGVQRRRASAVRCNARLSAGSSTFKPILSTELVRSSICGFLYVLAFQVVATELPGHLIH